MVYSLVRDDIYNFTEREIEVVYLVLDGLTNVEIADKLFISVNTVKAHLKSIYKKADITGRYQLFNKLQG